ncbi:MAG: LamG domain-containing protein [Phycisphaerales bacterium]|nr:LamG domain-containing protein [Phycisphaerales bacterium]
MSSGSFSIEVWARAADKDQRGPARIVSISKDTGSRNVTLGQEGTQLVLRLRTSATNDQGQPELMAPEGTLDPERFQHIVATYDGIATVLYVDGQRVAESESSAGSLEKWDKEMPLIIGNEATGDRPWRGQIRLVAIHVLPLSDAEVTAAFAAGPPGK